MDFEHDESERVRAREFGEAVIADSVIARDRAAHWNAELIRALATTLGGEASATVWSRRLIGLVEGSGDVGLALAWANHEVGVRAIAGMGTPAQRERWLPALVHGESIVGLVHARGGLVDPAVADVFVVATKAGAFLLERGSNVGHRLTTVGLRTTVIAPLHFEEPTAEHRLGGEDRAALVRAWQRLGSTAVCVGLLGALVNACVAAARERRVGQTTRALLAELHIRTQVCRRVHARAAWRLDRGLAAADLELASASALLGHQLTTITPAIVERFGEALESAGAIERLARDASTLARLLDPPERMRTRVAAPLLGFMEATR